MMSDDEMRRAIEEPARRGRWELSPVVDLIYMMWTRARGTTSAFPCSARDCSVGRSNATLSGYTSAGGCVGYR